MRPLLLALMLTFWSSSALASYGWVADVAEKCFRTVTLGKDVELAGWDNEIELLIYKYDELTNIGSSTWVSKNPRKRVTIEYTERDDWELWECRLNIFEKKNLNFTKLEESFNNWADEGVKSNRFVGSDRSVGINYSRGRFIWGCEGTKYTGEIEFYITWKASTGDFLGAFLFGKRDRNNKLKCGELG